MSWSTFTPLAYLILVFWGVTIILFTFFPAKKRAITIGKTTSFLGIGLLAYFIIHLWIGLDRPPLRTLGETRLMYSFFLPLVGVITFFRWHYKWFLSYCLALAGLFLVINILHPETHDKTLMPALQSPWFIPHVIVYIFSYALLAASSLVAIKGLYHSYKKTTDNTLIDIADNMVYIGFSFLTLGLLFGALWAKEAWGHYWTWDPKETWAFMTWLGYLLYIHFRWHHKEKISRALWLLALAFIILLICWFGVNYLPTAAQSVHTYTQ